MGAYETGCSRADRIFSDVPQLHSETACLVRVDLRWIDELPDSMSGPVHPAPGVTLSASQAHIAANFLGARVGPIYWQETAKNRFRDICLDQEGADYFVFWNQLGGTTNVFVLPRRESGCAVAKVVFTTEKVNKDPERSAKEAFKEAVMFLRANGRQDYSSASGCIPPDKIEHLAAALREAEASTDSQPKPSKESSANLQNESRESVLDISSSPLGADIELDGHFIGNTPSSVAVSVGEHSVSISKNGYKKWERNINALSGKVSINADLQAEPKSASSQ